MNGIPVKSDSGTKDVSNVIKEIKQFKKHYQNVVIPKLNEEYKALEELENTMENKTVKLNNQMDQVKKIGDNVQQLTNNLESLSLSMIMATESSYFSVLGEFEKNLLSICWVYHILRMTQNRKYVEP